jgi:hypothetical protein
MDVKLQSLLNILDVNKKQLSFSAYPYFFRYRPHAVEGCVCMYIFRPRATNYSSSGYKNSNKRPWVICIQATHVLVAAGQDISETGLSRGRALTGQGFHRTGTGARFLGERTGFIRGRTFSRDRDRFRREKDLSGQGSHGAGISRDKDRVVMG